MIKKTERLVEFGEFRADLTQRLLFQRDQQIPLAPKAFDTLLALLEAGGRVVEKEELLRTIWPETFVEEGSLARNISVLRKALGTSSEDQSYIQTIPKRGYRLAIPVREVDLAPESTTVTRDETLERDLSISVKPPAMETGAAVHRRRSGLLRNLASVTVVLLAISGGAWWLTQSRRNHTEKRTVTNRQIRSIAVLPFQNFSGDSTQEYFSDGITDALITSLAQIRALRVISRTSVMRYRRTTKPLSEVAGELGVDAVLEGAVQREKDRVRITAKLIEAASDTHIWAQSYERDLPGLLRLESEIATEVAKEIQVQVAGETKRRFNNVRRMNSTAQEEYLLARHQQDKRDETHLKEAIGHFEQAIQLEPGFAEAYAGLAHAWIQRGVLGASGFRESETPARKAGLKSIELDPELAEAHEAMAHILMFYDMAWVSAEQEFRRAIELDPSNVDAHVYLAVLLETLGRFPEAIEEGRRSLELDPVSTTANSEYGRVLFRARRFDESIRQYQRTLQLDPQDAVTLYRLTDSYIEVGRLKEALDMELDSIHARATPGRYAQAAVTYARMGRPADASKMIDQAEHLGDKGPYSTSLALAYFSVGDRDRGFGYLTRAFDDRRYVNLLACDPRFDTVRNDPRFGALVHRLGLTNEISK